MSDDLISRQAAIAYAISGRVRTLPTSEDGENWIRTEDVRQSLLTMPSAEPEIIHCRECKYAHLTYSGDCKYCDKWVDDDEFKLTLYLDGDFYCGYAERRTDE